MEYKRNWNLTRREFFKLSSILACALSLNTLAVIKVQGAEPEATSTSTAFQVEWEALIAAAQREGRIVVAGGGGAGSSIHLFEHFGKKFGIRPVISWGSGREQASRMLAEQGAKRYEVDIVLAGLTTLLARLRPANALQPIPPFLFHPEVIDESLWYEGKHKYVDKDKFVFLYAARVSSPTGSGMSLWYNTNKVSQEEIYTLHGPWDILKPKWKGKFVANDPSLGGGGTGALITAWLHPKMGKDWLRAFWIEMKPFITTNQRIMEDGLVRGRFAWGYALGSNDLEELRDKGAPVSEEFPRLLVEEHLLGGSATSHGFAVARNVPHPNVTKLWINWFLSREGQTILHTLPQPGVKNPMHSRFSLRNDVPPGLTDPDRRRQPGTQYEWDPDFNPEYQDVRWESLKWIGKLLGRGR